MEKLEKKRSKPEGKLEDVGKGKKIAIIENEDNLTCCHCDSEGHDVDHCWKLHPKLKLKWACKHKRKKETTNFVMDLGLESKDETNLTTMGPKGKDFSTNVFLLIVLLLLKSMMFLKIRKEMSYFT